VSKALVQQLAVASDIEEHVRADARTTHAEVRAALLEFKTGSVNKTVVTTTVRRPFDCIATALRPFDDPSYDRAAALRPKYIKRSA